MLFEVSNQTGIDAFSTVARQLEDSLRAAIVRAGAAAVALDSAARSTRDVVERRQLGVRRGAGAIVDVALFRIRRDSVSVRLSVRDMTEERTLPTIEMRLAAGDVQQGGSVLGQISGRLAEALAQINWGPKAFR
jgi:ribosomal protein S1